MTNLLDDERNDTIDGEAEGDAVMKQIETSVLRENVKAFVFDNTASNAGAKRGATVMQITWKNSFLFCL